MISSAEVKIYSAAKLGGLNETLARFVVSQAAHETGGFVSPVFLKNNNAFGMKYAGQELATGKKNGYANYESVESSTLDVVKWIYKHYGFFLMTIAPINTLSEYVSFLKRNNYFEAPESEYLKGCEHWYKKIFNG